MRQGRLLPRAPFATRHLSTPDSTKPASRKDTKHPPALRTGSRHLLYHGGELLVRAEVSSRSAIYWIYSWLLLLQRIGASVSHLQLVQLFLLIHDQDQVISLQNVAGGESRVHGWMTAAPPQLQRPGD